MMEMLQFHLQCHNDYKFATGAGKSSMVAALLRLTEIEGGAILVDGRDIGAVPLKHLRSAIACVPQTPFLFQVGSCTL